MQTKKIRKFFGLADFIEEQEFLEQQHREGWRFISTTGFSYKFESCDPEDVVYQLDFNGENKDIESYLQLYADCGWTHMFKYNEWHYFMKTREANEDLTIFSDKESKIEMCKRVLNKHIFMVIPFLIFMIIADYNIYFVPTFGGAQNVARFWATVGLCIIISLVLGLVNLFKAMFKLRHMITKLDEPIKERK